MLVANLISGGLWLLVPLALGGLVLALIGAGYVVVAGAFLAWAYGRERLSARQEALVWVAPWLLAVAVWAVVLGGVAGGSYSVALWVGLIVGTPCYLVWQMLAAALRQGLAWRAASRETRV